MKYQLILHPIAPDGRSLPSRASGPYTARQCRDEVDAANGGRKWHWRSGGYTQEAIDSETHEILAEAVPFA